MDEGRFETGAVAPRGAVVRRRAAILLLTLAAVVVVTVREAKGQAPPAPGVPTLSLETADGAPIRSRRTYVDGSVTLSAEGVDAAGRPTADAAPSHVRVRGRGNTSWDHPKKPLRLRFDEPTDLLGAGAAETWVLLANYIDPSGLRNATAFELGRRLRMPFTPEARHVRLVLNGTPQGLYLLTEQTEVAPHRVVTGDDGFLVEFDDYDDPDEEIFSTRVFDLPLKIRTPKLRQLPPDARAEAVARVTGAVDDLERVLAAEGGPGDYAAVLDVDSFVDWFLVHEITHNYEPLHPKSCFFHRGADGRIVAGPIWDFDWAFDHETMEPDVLLLRDVAWFRHLFEDPAFVARVKARWRAVRDGPVASLPAYVEGLADSIRPAVAEDTRLWPLDEDDRTPSEAADLAEWLRRRIATLDHAIDRLP